MLFIFVKGTDPDSTFSLQKEKQVENKKILESGIKMMEWEDPELTSSQKDKITLIGKEILSQTDLKSSRLALLKLRL